MDSKYILFAGWMLVFAGCNKKSASENQTEKPKLGTEINAAPETAPVIAVPDTFKVALGKVFDGYLQIQTALAHDDLVKAKAAFSNMHALLHVMPIDALDSAGHNAWSLADTRIMETLHPMATASTLDSTRIYFMDFSQELANAIDTFGLPTGTRVYRFHCPMANGNQGADWMQTDSVLANPYFGKSMLTCGSMIKKSNS